MRSPPIDCILTLSGCWLSPRAPQIEHIRLEDIAHGLALTNRWSGQTAQRYSVAQHSLEVARSMPSDSGRQEILGALLHDAAEAYMGDVPRPVKRFLPDYSAMEARLLDVIGDALGVQVRHMRSAAVCHADGIVLAWEYRDIVHGPLLDVPPIIVDYLPHVPIYRLAPSSSWEYDKEMFLAAAHSLGLSRSSRW